MRIDRLLAITVLLLNRRRVTAREMADRFEVSAKTIYRDIDSLCQSGIPVVTFKGVDGGFEIMESYTLDRQLLTQEELGILSSAVNGMKSALDDERMYSTRSRRWSEPPAAVQPPRRSCLISILGDQASILRSSDCAHAAGLTLMIDESPSAPTGVI